MVGAHFGFRAAEGSGEGHSGGHVAGSGGVLDDFLLQFGHGDGEPGADFGHPLVGREGVLEVVVEGFGSTQGVGSARGDAVVGYEEKGDEVESS